MKLSFVIPAYNEEACLASCLPSVLRALEGRPPEDFEVIVVNNASKDRTKQVALSFPGVRVIDELRKGLTYARQAGFQASQGDLIANVDADTIVPVGWLDRVLREFDQNPNLVGLSGPHKIQDVGWAAQIGVSFFYVLGYLSYVVNYHLLKKGGMLQGGNFILKRTALERIGGFDTSISFYGEDSDIARRIQTEGEVKFTFALPIYASGRRLNSEGMFTMGIRYALNYLWVLFLRRPFSKEYRDIR